MRSGNISATLASCAVALALGVPAFAHSADQAAPICPGGKPDVVDGLRTWPAEQAPPVEIDGAQWFQAPEAWFVVANACAAVIAAEEMRAAQEAFARYFGEPVALGAVLDGAYADHSAALRRAGAAWVMMWRFGDRAGDDSLDATRRQMAARPETRGLGQGSARFAALVWGALKRLSGDAPRPARTLNPEVLRHEIAHKLFIHSIWPAPGNGTSYGGGAPDWLDEAAAVLAETESMANDRRNEFRSIARDGGLIPLSEYFSMEHPVFSSADLRRQLEEGRQNVRQGEPIVISTDSSQTGENRSRAFYAQTRGMIDYLVERSGNQRILLLITRALMDGQTFEQWLAEAGPGNGLPTGIDELDDRFRAWAMADG